MSAGWLKVNEEAADASTLSAGGEWTIRHAGELDAQLRMLVNTAADSLGLDFAEVEHLDTTGAWLLHRTIRDLRERGLSFEIRNIATAHASLISQIAENDRPAPDERPQWNPIFRVLVRTGYATLRILEEVRLTVGFIGMLSNAVLRSFMNPSRMRFTPAVHHMEKVGLNALPIVALVSFLIGVVLAYQGVDQLRRFGAEIFVVNMVAVSVLREIGILLTAIVVAGRSGSAFTAEIGTMIVNEEVDAMRTLGLDPMEVLVMPRMLALVVMLPILAFISDLMGLLGGLVMCWSALDITPRLFMEQLNDAVGLWTFWVGMIKAPVFAVLIGVTGCYHGLRVTHTAASVGQRTTTSVVYSIFLIIIADAAFSILFSMFGV